MRNYFLTIFILFALVLLPKVTFASCVIKPSVKDEAKSASLVFIGTVAKITPAQIASAGYPINRKKIVWEKYFHKTDVVTFTVSEVFKGVSNETIEIATSAEGDAGYTFEGGTWLKEGQTYLVYAYKRDLADNEIPKNLANEINEFNGKITPYSASICGRTTNIKNAAEELEEIRKMFPEAKRFSTQTDVQRINGHEAETATVWQRLLTFFGLA